MGKKIDFSKCPHFDRKGCPGKNPETYGNSAGDFYVDWDGNKYTISEIHNFIKNNNCKQCPKVLEWLPHK